MLCRWSEITNVSSFRYVELNKQKFAKAVDGAFFHYCILKWAYVFLYLAYTGKTVVSDVSLLT
jgi:hypothetical protein